MVCNPHDLKVHRNEICGISEFCSNIMLTDLFFYYNSLFMIPKHLNFTLCRAGDFDFLGASGNKSDGFYEKSGYNSSGSSRNSSISSTSSASSGSGWRMTSRTGDLDADADSLTCRQSGLTCNDDRPKMV